jgi:hypothetical protein
MTKEIRKYERQLVIELKSGRKLMTAEKHFDAIAKDLESKRFLKVEGVLINALEVKTVEPLSEEFDVLIGLNEQQRAIALQEFKLYKQNLGKEPSREIKLKKIQRLLKEG